MALTAYKAKRNLKESPEPAGGQPDSKRLRFVVQKHHASRLHYDFRLEVNGVLKSWAVPKGPSTDPNVKRLAMMVEDHPYDYRNFEGIIPSGYGAGTVIVWDEGYYAPVADIENHKKSQEKELAKGIKAGKIHFVMLGKKLKGEYALVKTKGREENVWLLFKVKDKFASTTDITKKDKSVLSNKTLEQVAKANGKSEKTVKKSAIKSVNKTAAAKKTKARTKSTQKKTPLKSDSKLNGSKPLGKRAPFPSMITPMLATLVDKPFD